MRSACRGMVLTTALMLWFLSAGIAQTTPQELESQLFSEGYLSATAQQHLADEFLFQNAVQTYLWALPALNIYGMKEGSEKVFGKGYNVLPIWKDRLNAKTVVIPPRRSEALQRPFSNTSLCVVFVTNKRHFVYASKPCKLRLFEQIPEI